MTTSSQQTALDKPVAIVAYFVYLDFIAGGVSSPIRFCTYNNTFSWGGHDWIGAGAVGSISPITEASGVPADSVSFGLNVADPSLLSLAMAAVENYRGRAARLNFCPLTPEGVLIDQPMLAWRGKMDVMSISVDGDKGQILLKCETSAFGLRRKPNLRMNAAQQKQKHQTDTGFDQLNDLISNPQLWLSRRFQQV